MAQLSVTLEQVKRRYKPQPVLEKPSGVILLLDAAFAAIRQRPKKILTLSGLPMVPLLVVAAVNYKQFQPNELEQALVGEAYEYDINGPSVFLGFIFCLILASLSLVSISYLVFGWLDGKDFGVKESLLACKKSFGMLLIVWVIILPPIMLGSILVFPGVALVVMFASVPSILAVENVGPIQALKRSWQLQSKRFWLSLGLFFLTQLVAGFYFFAVFIWAGAVGFGGSLSFFYIVFFGVSLAASVVMAALVSVILCLNYIDGRFRTEGLDIAIKAEKVFSR